MSLPHWSTDELIFDYDESVYDFRELVESVLGETSLEDIHRTPQASKILSTTRPEKLKAPRSSRNCWNKRWRTAMQEGSRRRMQNLMSRFCAEVCAPMLGCDCVVHQAIPTFRVHVAGVGKLFVFITCAILPLQEPHHES